MVSRTLICGYLLAAVAIPVCCCDAEAWGQATRPSKAHACCGDADAGDRAPASTACECGCSHDLFPQTAPAATVDSPTLAPDWARAEGPLISGQPDAFCVISSHALACHDPPGFGTHRFLILLHFRC